jgi:hypothetical protein
MVVKYGIGVSVVVLAGMLAGCTQTNRDLADIPGPRFSGPAIAKATPAPAAPVASNSSAPALRPIYPAGVPREWVPNVTARPWRWIVIHHSATPTGSAAKFDRDHRAKGWDELGYHFVIGNGTETRNGQVEVGPRWPKQKWGAHAKTPDNRYNDFGIGICLVGNFDVEHPNAEQIRSLAKLVAYLMKTYNISPDRVIRHKDTKSTDCPGQYVSIDQVRRMATQMLADSGQRVPIDTQLAGGELLMPVHVK